MSTSRELVRVSQLSDDSQLIIQTNQRSVVLTVNDARRWLGAETAPSYEIMKFLMTCQARRVDPFLGEAHFFEMAGRWTTVVDISGWIEVAEIHPQYDGHECGLVIQQVITPAKPATKTTPAQPAVMGEIRNIDDCIRPEGWNVIGGWCRVHRKDRRIPTYRAVSMLEYNRDNRQWKALPHTMIVKVAVVQALAASGIVARSGGYIREELPEPQAISPGENQDDSTDRDVIDVEIEEVPAIEDAAADQPPKDEEQVDAEVPEASPTTPDASPQLSPDIARELMEELGRSGMTDYQIDCMLARRGASEINELADTDAREIISKLRFKWDQDHAGEILLPDPQPAGKATQGDDEGGGDDTSELTEINGDIVNADGEVVGTVRDTDEQTNSATRSLARYMAKARGWKLTDNGHMLYTPQSHRCDPDNPAKCPVCDGGLSVCAVCGLAESELSQPCPGVSQSPSDPPEAYAIQRADEIAAAHAMWQRANERHDVVTATGIMESIVEAYGPEALAGWDILSADGPVDPTASPADSFEISEVPRREERVEPVKKPRGRPKKA